MPECRPCFRRARRLRRSSPYLSAAQLFQEVCWLVYPFMRGTYLETGVESKREREKAY